MFVDGLVPLVKNRGLSRSGTVEVRHFSLDFLFSISRRAFHLLCRRVAVAIIYIIKASVTRLVLSCHLLRAVEGVAVVLLVRRTCQVMVCLCPGCILLLLWALTL